jgi:hypothetical protein
MVFFLLFVGSWLFGDSGLRTGSIVVNSNTLFVWLIICKQKLQGLAKWFHLSLLSSFYFLFTLSQLKFINGRTKLNASRIDSPSACFIAYLRPSPTEMISKSFLNTMWNGNSSKNTSLRIGKFEVAFLK